MLFFEALTMVRTRGALVTARRAKTCLLVWISAVYQSCPVTDDRFPVPGRDVLCPGGRVAGGDVTADYLPSNPSTKTVERALWANPGPRAGRYRGMSVGQWPCQGLGTHGVAG